MTSLEPQGLGPEHAHLQRALTDALTVAVADSSGCEVLSSNDIATMADFEAQREACGTQTESCLAELGNALGVERIVSGTVVRVGERFTVTASLLNIGAARVEARAEETTTDVNALRPLSQVVGRRLFGSDPQPAVPWPFVAAGVIGAVGVLGVGLGVVMAVGAEGVLADAGSSRADKDAAFTSGIAGVIGAGVGAGAVVGATAAVMLWPGGE